MFPGEALCPGSRLEVVDGDELVDKPGTKPPENRLGEAVKYIIDAIEARKPQQTRPTTT